MKTIIYGTEIKFKYKHVYNPLTCTYKFMRFFVYGITPHLYHCFSTCCIIENGRFSKDASNKGDAISIIEEIYKMGWFYYISNLYIYIYIVTNTYNYFCKRRLRKTPHRCFEKT